MNFDKLSDTLKERVIKATTPEEILSIAQEEGFELTEDELGAISGGSETWCRDCNNYCMSDCGTL